MIDEKAERRGCLQIFGAGILWGFLGVFVTEMTKLGATPQLQTFLKQSFACVIMLVLTLIRYGWKALRIDKKTLGICIVTGIVTQAICNVAYSYTITELGVSVAVVFMDTAPIFTIFFAVMLFHEPVGSRKLLAIFINIVGCVLAATGGHLAGAMSLFGIGAGLVSGLTYGLSPILGRYATNRTNPFVLCVYCYLSAAIFMAICSQPWQFFDRITPTVLVWGFLFGLIPTSITYILYYGGISKISESGKVPVIASVELPVATLVGVCLYGDPIGLGNIIGILLVLGSIVLMNQTKKKSIA